MSSTAGAVTHVLDVSSYQGSPVWPAVARSTPAPLRACYVKASQGIGYRNPYRVEQARGAAASGLAVGAYHFAEPGSGSGSTQARYFLAAQPRSVVLQPMLDLEWNEHRLSGPALSLWIRDYCETVHAALGRRPLLYCSPAWWGENILHPAGLSDELVHYFGNRRLWVAHYDVGRPLIPPPWTHYSLWQHSRTTHRDGIGTVDDSYLALSLDALRLPLAGRARARMLGSRP